ncbi:MAG: hypothetical protein Q7U04_08750 [Bacteriovorax sp.]|nr:hypothetical protein [Bacteriovorax sp.]
MNILLSAFLLTLSFSAFSKCEVNYDRTACKGKEAESYAKCDGKKTCTKIESAEDEMECKDAAYKACANSRIDITKSKTITAKWNGKEVVSKTNKKNFCEDYEKKDAEFNKCQ